MKPALGAGGWDDVHRAPHAKGEQPMSDNPEQRQVQLRIDESKMQTTYANTIRTSTTQDEVIMDYGVNIPVQGQDGQPAMNFGITSRVIMNWSGAKRLAINLGQVIRAYEERNGEIELQRPQQPGAEG
ncbi:MAG: DUF3467 domain-containing protein [Planctomycetota bacterium]